MSKILLIRHGHVEGIKPERFRGREPLELTEQGRAQATCVARRIASRYRLGKLYTSPMGRCVKTAAAIAEACRVTAETCDELNDIDYGAWQFKSFEQAKLQDPALFAAWLATPHLVRFPNGESLQDVAARSANALRLVLARHPDDTVALVSHDSVSRTLLLQFLDLSLSSYWRIAQRPCCINEIDIVDGRICVQRINETSHLDEDPQ